MTDINQQLRSRIEGFVSEIAELVRQATLESVYATLGAVETRTRGGSRGAPRGRSAASFPAVVAGRRGGKRSPDEIEAMSSEILNHISENPGQGVEQISSALGISSKELTLPIRKLVGQGDLRTEGQKRATKYFSGGARANTRGGAKARTAAPVIKTPTLPRRKTAPAAKAQPAGRKPAGRKPAGRKKARGRK